LANQRGGFRSLKIGRLEQEGVMRVNSDWYSIIFEAENQEDRELLEKLFKRIPEEEAQDIISYDKSCGELEIFTGE
jgi:hypothetical protein